MKLADLSLKELAAYVSHHLRENGIDNVLTGGACVSIYTKNRYLSYDLDFVNIADAPLSKIDAALDRIGFKKQGRIYVNDAVRYSVDILNPPLSIGEDKINNIRVMTFKKMVLKLLSPTDSVKDRLAAFYFWNDRQALEQAVLICRDNQVDFKNIARWSEKENEKDKFKMFMNKIKKL